MRRIRGGVVARNTLSWGVDIEVDMRKSDISLFLSYLTKSDFLFLKCLIGQFKRQVAAIIDVHSVVSFHFFMVRNREH